MRRTLKRSIALIVAAAMILSFIPMMQDNAFAAKAKKPGKVKSVKAKVSGTKVSVSWKKAKNAKKYEVQIKDNGTKLVAQKKVKKTKFKFTGKTGTKYTIRVRGIKGKKNGKWSKAAKAIIPAEKQDDSGAKAAEEAKAKAELDKAEAEKKAADAEAAKAQAELAQKKAEADKAVAEKKAADAEAAKKEADDKARAADAAKEAAEADKAASDAAKEEAEQAAEQANQEKEQAIADKEAAEKELADANAVLDVTNKALPLPEEADVTYQDREAVREAAAALEELDDELKGKVNEALKNKIAADKEKIDTMQEIVDQVKALDETALEASTLNKKNVGNYQVTIDGYKYTLIARENGKALLISNEACGSTTADRVAFKSDAAEVSIPDSGIDSADDWASYTYEPTSNWANSDIRSMLNGSFLEDNPTVRGMALSTEIDSSVVKSYMEGTSAATLVNGSNVKTTDKVFILSCHDIRTTSGNDYFTASTFDSTGFAMNHIQAILLNGAWFRDTVMRFYKADDGEGTVTRSVTELGSYVQIMNGYSYNVLLATPYGVCPAFWIELGE